MTSQTRRALLRGFAAAAATAAAVRPYVANAAVSTATVWWAQGAAESEDAEFTKIIGEYQKASGNTIDLTIMPYAPLRQRIAAAMGSGSLPDLFQDGGDTSGWSRWAKWSRLRTERVLTRATPGDAVALYAWQDKLADLTDVVETQKSQYTDTALLAVNCYNSANQARSFYGAPFAQTVAAAHISKPLVEKAGLRIADLPKSWDGYFDAFKEAQKKLRGQGMRHVYGLGFQLTLNGSDPNALFNQFLIAYGGQDIVTKGGKPNLASASVREAALKALSYPAAAYKDGFVPPGAINWRDGDDDKALHAGQVVMTIDGPIATEPGAERHTPEQDEIVTMSLPPGNDGKAVPSQVEILCGLVPKGAKNIAVAKDLLKYLIQPKVISAYLKTGDGRRAPAMPAIAKDDPWWIDPRDQLRSTNTRQALLGPTVPPFWALNPAWSRIQYEHVWPAGWANIMTGRMTPQAAAEKAFRRVERIFEKYPIA